jgi:hypothetical protein
MSQIVWVPQPASVTTSPTAEMYERRHAAKMAASGLGAAPEQPTGLGATLAAGLASVMGLRRPR